METSINLSGYQIIEQLYTGNRTLVYRGMRTSDQHPVVIKILRNKYPNFNEIVQFRNQYTIAKNLNFPGIIKPLKIEEYNHSYALIMEDFGGISLGDYFFREPNKINLIEFLEIALKITDILHYLYQNKVIHKDIKPANILINPDTKETKLIDFSISSLLSRETQEIQNANGLEGTLAYLSPEQTGRMNRGIDYRTDFYSLGVTFYELLTGALPFQSEDAMELVHCHLAKKAPSIAEINPEIPPVLSKIVDKLMAKNAENRYQSAWGIKHDLETCLIQLQTTGKIADFEIGKNDHSDRFLIPEKLYGRNLEVKTLLEGFDRVANGTSELILVAGFSGIGKTAVVNEIHKPITRQKGYFIKGKFDQFNRNIPFSAFVQAFRDLMGQLLSDSDKKLQKLRTKLLESLGENGQIIIEVIPELEQIIGQQPPVVELTGSASQNRFNLLFSKFLEVFTTKEHPLVIFLDDLQWADLASLKLMQTLMGDKTKGYLLLIGAYRDNEVFDAHPLRQTLAEMLKLDVTIQTITLPPLAINDLNHLIADTLNCVPELAQPLTDLVYSKTQGNPFFTTQLLKSFHEDGLIIFNPPSFSNGKTEGGWECNMAQIRTLTLTDDVVEFMALQLQKLSIETQTVLKLAACIGNHFDLETLSITYEKSVLETASDLWKALQEGFILPQSEVYKFFLTKEQYLTNDQDHQIIVNYRFLHDRVQQAAYALIPEDSKQLTHLKIGKILLDNTANIEHSEKIFDIVNQLNRGIDLITEQTEKNQLAKLNLVAGNKAKASTAYGAAVAYLNLGLQLLPVNSWENQYDLTLKLHIEAIQAEYLNTNFDQANALGKIVLQQANSLLDQVRVYELEMQMSVAKLELIKTIEIGLQVLEMLEVTLEKPVPVNLVVEDLANLPEMIDPQKIAAMRILMTLIAAAYFADPPLLFPIILTMIHLSCKYGNSSYSAYGYVLYGLLLCGPLGDIESGYSYGKLALQLLDSFNAKELRTKILLVYNGNIRHWKEHTKTTLEPLLEAIQVGVETGDIEYAGYATTNYCDQRMAIGESLELMEQQRRQYIDLMQKFKQEYSINNQKMGLQMTLNLLGKAEDKCQLIGPDFDETKMLPIFWEAKTATLLFYFHWFKGRLLYIFESAQEAINMLKIAEQYMGSVAGMVMVGEHNFYYSLALLAVLNNPNLEQQNESEQANYLDQVITNQKNLGIWANLAPCNFQHKYQLIEAEKANFFKENWQAGELYDRAIAGAKENGYIQEEALGNELAAKFYLKCGKGKVAAGYMQEAYYCYSRWGAKAKIVDLEQRYPQLLTPILQSAKNQEITTKKTITTVAKGTVTNTSSGNNILLDCASGMKAAQAISGEIDLEKLLATLMKIVTENAGAQTGILVLKQEEQWLVVARGNQNNTENLLISLGEYQALPKKLIYAVARSQKMEVFDNISASPQWVGNPYIITHQPKSVLCIPISKQGKMLGILYLENNLTEGAFTSDRVETLQLLTAQAAISIENALLYQQIEKYSQNLEAEVARKTADLSQKAFDLEETLKNLQNTQAQLIQSEKMSSLGQLVAGIAHEINNPVGFIMGNLDHTETYVKDLLILLDLYQQKYPEPDGIIQAKIEEIDLEFLWEDLTKILQSMKVGTERISQIILSLRNFSRLDESDMKAVDLHSGIDSTLLILQSRLKATGNQPEITVIKEYGKLPKVACYPSQLNQVFLSVISNAIDALQEISKTGKKPVITITTEVIQKERVRIAIIDNGSGIPIDIQQRIFDPFFTTKPVGSGTGLGLSTSYTIIKKHGGQLTCNSTLDKGTEFFIEIPIHQ